MGFNVRKRTGLLIAAGLTLVLHSVTTAARDFRVGMIPNGGVFSCATCHNSVFGGDLRNPFGFDVEVAIGVSALAIPFWTPAFAARDSDGDGFTNGQELGDPDGNGSPTPGAVVTNPGDASSRPSNTAPQVQLTKPSEGATFLSSEAIALEASASDADGSGSSVEFRADATSLITKSSAPFTHTIAAGSLAAGSHLLRAVATDNQGAKATSAPVSITILASNQPPSITIVRTSTNTVFVRPQVVSIEANPSDSDGSIVRVEFLRGTNILFTATDAPYTFQLDTATITPGTFDIVARAVDNRGASATASPFTLTVLTELRIASTTAKTNTVDILLPSPVGARFTVQASTNLTTWVNVGTITATAQGARYTEPAGTARRFYRFRLEQ